LNGNNLGCMTASDSLFDSRGRFSGVKLSNENIAEIEVLRDVTCHGNQFWDYISCKWTLAGDKDMRISYRPKGWVAFSQPLRLLVAISGFAVATIRTVPGGECQVEN